MGAWLIVSLKPLLLQTGYFSSKIKIMNRNSIDISMDSNRLDIRMNSSSIDYSRESTSVDISMVSNTMVICRDSNSMYIYRDSNSVNISRDCNSGHFNTSSSLLNLPSAPASNTCLLWTQPPVSIILKPLPSSWKSHAPLISHISQAWRMTYDSQITLQSCHATTGLP